MADIKDFLALIPSKQVISRTARTSDTALTVDNHAYFIDITSGTFSQTFNSASSLGNGWWIIIKNSGTGTITLDPYNTQSIDGVSTVTLLPGQSRIVGCDGVNLYTVLTEYTYGTSAHNAVKLDANAKLPAVDGSQLTGVAGAGLSLGTSANNIVQLDGSAKLPAVDGSQLTNLSVGQANFIATGEISPGFCVGLNADGTVQQIKTYRPVFEKAGTYYSSMCYDAANQKVVIAYQDVGNSNYGTAIVGTVSGTSISFGTAVVFESAATYYISACYDSTNQKVVIAYADTGNSYYGTAIVGTVSGTSISFGTAVVFESSYTDYISTCYDSTNQKVVIAYQDGGNSSYGTAIVGTVSGTSISFGTAVVFESASTSYISTCYNSTNQKVVIAYQDAGNSSYGTAIVGTVSGTSISFGSAEVFFGLSVAYISACYDSTNNKVVIAFKNGGNSFGTAIVGTVSGTSISFGAIVYFEPANLNYISTCYDSVNNKVVIVYSDYGNNYYGTAIAGVVSGTSICFGTPTIFKDAQVSYISACYDSTSHKVVIAYCDNGNGSYGTATVMDTTQVEAIGMVFEADNTIHTVACYDSVNQKVVIAYRDGGNSGYGTAIVGTVSGNSISFGSPNVFEYADTYSIAICYSTAHQKVVISYGDGGSADYGTSIVGTVSGTSISFGSPNVWKNVGTSHISNCYDPVSQKIVIAYRSSSTSYGEAIVGTISGTSISYGDYAVFENADTYYTSVCYDSTNQKVVIAYQDIGNNGYGTAVVGTVSGNSISFGSPVVYANAYAPYVSACYDSANQKVVIAYRDAGNSNYGTAIVGTVTGTSISFGTAVVFERSSTSYTSACYDSTNQKVEIAYRNDGNNGYGTTIVGTVSGTSISFGTAVVFESSSASYTSACHDSANQKVVIAYRDAGNNSYGTAVVFPSNYTTPTYFQTDYLPSKFIGIAKAAASNAQSVAVTVFGGINENVSGLTPGSTYYADYDGTLTTNVTTKAGRALSATKLLVTGG